MALSKEVLELLACPACRGTLDLVDGFLVCPECRLKYPVQDGIPLLLREAAQSA